MFTDCVTSCAAIGAEAGLSAVMDQPFPILG
ncbi:hypothetical protein BXY39_1585 [Eilatimonas milleporae]|uniref:Uncharacterized protein n=1 Tax=Eilatimonas milleporae TaxID=911205 RepID=A0A3M0CH79_9PROT|nr:hypothetical protein BXY39_1585 [Eilatimonas milleporae]